MDVNISGHHVDLNNGLRKHITEKFTDMDRFFHGCQSADVILKNDDRRMHCEVILHVKNSDRVVIDVMHDDLHAAIDLAVDKCERQLRRLKEKRTDRRRRSSTSINKPVLEESDDSDEE